jgi:hypothetical protein
MHTAAAAPRPTTTTKTLLLLLYALLQYRYCPDIFLVALLAACGCV